MFKILFKFCCLLKEEKLMHILVVLFTLRESLSSLLGFKSPNTLSPLEHTLEE